MAVRRRAVSSRVRDLMIVIYVPGLAVARSCKLLLESRNRRRGKCSVRVGYCLLLLVVAIESGDGIERAYRRANEDVAIECSS